jgi:hypothetical protein
VLQPLAHPSVSVAYAISYRWPILLSLGSENYIDIVLAPNPLVETCLRGQAVLRHDKIGGTFRVRANPLPAALGVDLYLCTMAD